MMKDVVIIRNEDGSIIIQDAQYIEHGAYIKAIDDLIEVWEIPYGGGDECLVKTCSTLKEAFDTIDKLT